MTEDTNDNFAFEPGAGDTVIPTFPKTVEYTLNAFTRNDTLATTTAVIPITNVRINYDKRGLISSAGTAVLFNPATPTTGIISLTSTADPDYDCIVIASTRINIGKWNTAPPGNCDAK